MCESCEKIIETIKLVEDVGIFDDVFIAGALAEVEQCETKTQAYYQKAMERVVKKFYDSKIDETQFLDGMITLVEDQFGRAFREGLRAGGVDPLTDMRPEWRAMLQARIQSEMEYIIPFAEAIIKARGNPAALPALLARVSLWANRYPEIADWALSLVYDGNMIWVLGATEQHCSTCSGLHGIVAHISEWQAARVVPQNAPNPMLECGGWRCDCRLKPVKQRKSPDALTKILDIVTATTGRL